MRDGAGTYWELLAIHREADQLWDDFWPAEWIVP